MKALSNFAKLYFNKGKSDIKYPFIFFKIHRDKCNAFILLKFVIFSINATIKLIP